jgi:hypothetical protein
MLPINFDEDQENSLDLILKFSDLSHQPDSYTLDECLFLPTDSIVTSQQIKLTSFQQ